MRIIAPQPKHELIIVLAMVATVNVTSSAYYISIDWPMEEIVIGGIILAIWVYSILQFIR